MAKLPVPHAPNLGPRLTIVVPQYMSATCSFPAAVQAANIIMSLDQEREKSVEYLLDAQEGANANPLGATYFVHCPQRKNVGGDELKVNCGIFLHDFTQAISIGASAINAFFAQKRQEFADYLMD